MAHKRVNGSKQWCCQAMVWPKPKGVGYPREEGGQGKAERGCRQAERPAWLGDRNTLNPLLRIKHCIWDSGDGNWQCQERSSCRKARTTPRCTVMATLPENSPEPPQHSPAPDLAQPGPGPSSFVLKLSWISSLRVNSTEVAGRVPGVQGTQGQRGLRPGIVPGRRSSTLH